MTKTSDVIQAKTVEPENLPAPRNPMELLAVAVQSGRGADEIATLSAVYERWEKEQARKAYNTAMVKAQREMPSVVRDGNNPQSNSKYPKLESVQDRVRPVCLNNGFHLSFSQSERIDGELVTLKCIVGHEGGHTETFFRHGEVDDHGIKGNKNKIHVQGVQSSITYMRRNMILEIFNVVVADTDKDGAADDSFITPDQQSILHMLIKATDTDLTKFLEFGKCEDLATFPASKYVMAKAMLEKKAGAK